MFSIIIFYFINFLIYFFYFKLFFYEFKKYIKNIFNDYLKYHNLFKQDTK